MRRKFLHSGRGNIRIRGGDVLPIILAKQVCRCLECLGKLTDATNGLICAQDETHQGIVHQKEAARLAQERAAQFERVSEHYVIDGVILADDPIGDEPCQ